MKRQKRIKNWETMGILRIVGEKGVKKEIPSDSIKREA